MTKREPLDITFGDVPSKKTTKKKEKEEGNQATGIILSIPAGKHKFLQKDLALCSPEEFLEWASFVYPDTKAAKADDFISFTARRKAMKQIIQYHLGNMTPEERSTKH